MPCPLPGSLTKQERAIAIRRENPNLSYPEIAERLGVGARSVRRWLTPTGLGQQRTEDRRGQANIIDADTSPEVM